MEKRISILGLGWLGLPLGISLHNMGYRIQGSYSNPDRKSFLETMPFPCERIRISPTHIEGSWESFIQNTDVLIVNIPPRKNKNGEIEYAQCINQIIRHTLPNQKIIFVSSTSIYGPIPSKITEETIPQPNTLSGQALLNSEQALKTHFKENLTILRFSGLVGPLRHPGNFLAGRKGLSNANALVNIIHQTDCIQLISTIIKDNVFGFTINACADEHPTKSEFYTKATELLNLELPQFNEDPTSSTKYIDNTLSKQLLEHNYMSIDQILANC